MRWLKTVDYDAEHLLKGFGRRPLWHLLCSFSTLSGTWFAQSDASCIRNSA